MNSRHVQIHPKVNPELGKALEAFAKANGVSLNQATKHVLALGLKQMTTQFSGSLSNYIANISLTDQEIH